MLFHLVNIRFHAHAKYTDSPQRLLLLHQNTGYLSKPLSIYPTNPYPNLPLNAFIVKIHTCTIHTSLTRRRVPILVIAMKRETTNAQCSPDSSSQSHPYQSHHSDYLPSPSALHSHSHQASSTSTSSQDSYHSPHSHSASEH